MQGQGDSQQFQRVEWGELGPRGPAAQPLRRHGIPKAAPPPQLVSSQLQEALCRPGRPLAGRRSDERDGAGGSAGREGQQGRG